MESITKTLGGGSGIDTTALVSGLVDTQFATKNAKLTEQSDALDAKISAVSSIKSALTGFASALKTLVNGGTLATQPTSSDSGVLKATAIPGAKLAGLSASVEVRQLATGQTANTGIVADASAAVGKGTLTLTFGTASVTSGAMDSFAAGSGTPIDITIDDSNSTLAGIAKAINDKNAGVTATVLSDVDGARLVIKGPTGSAQAFTLTATEDPAAPGLSALDIGVGASGTTIGTAAQDAIVAVDGVALKRSTNSINDLVAGVQLDLVSAKPGTTVALGSTPATDSLRFAVTDYVDTYNQLLSMVQEATDPKTGDLRGDSAARALLTSLSQLTLTNLNSSAGPGVPRTLAEIGVKTGRDGTLSVDTDRLNTVLADHPQAVEKIFSAGVLSQGDGISGALSALSVRSTSLVYGLGASAARYQSQQQDVSDEQDKATADAETLRTRLTQQFASMDAKVAAYKSTQTFLQQQIDAWNQKN